jgi:hypothetical protein
LPEVTRRRCQCGRSNDQHVTRLAARSKRPCKTWRGSVTDSMPSSFGLTYQQPRQIPWINCLMCCSRRSACCVQCPMKPDPLVTRTDPRFTECSPQLGNPASQRRGTCAEYDWSDNGARPRRESDLLRPTSLYGQAKASTASVLQAGPSSRA